MAQTVRVISPPTMWFSQRNIGAGRKRSHEVPVATERTAVTIMPTTATVLAVTPRLKATFTTDAPTPLT